KSRGVPLQDRRIRRRLWSSPVIRNESPNLELSRFVTFQPSILFLSETKMWDTKAKNFMWSLGYAGSYAVSCEGRSGGLALFWKQSFSVSLRGVNSHCIDVIVSAEDLVQWCATFVYGEPKRELRHIFWDMLCRLLREW